LGGFKKEYDMQIDRVTQCIWVYYGFSLLHKFSLVLQPGMSAYIRKTDGVYISAFQKTIE